MTYSIENAKDNNKRNILVSLKPRKRVTSWTLLSGSVYYNDFLFGYVSGVAVNGVALSEGTSSTLSAGQFYFDQSINRVYIRKLSGTPQSSDWIVVTFDLYLATKEIYWHRVPTDSTTPIVFWHGIITNPPSVSRSASDILFGYVPTSVTNLSCVYEKTVFQPIVYDASFNNAEVSVYHLAGELKSNNIQKIFTGLSGDLDFDDSEITIDLFDKAYRFNEPVNNGAKVNRYPDAANIDPLRINTFIRSIYGLAESSWNWFGTNIDYDSTSPTTSDNRDWSFSSQITGSTPWQTVTVVSSPTIYQVEVSATDIKKFFVTGGSGTKVKATTNGYTEVVSISGNILTFSSLVNAPDQTGGVIYIIGYPDAKLIQNNTVYDLIYGRDYTDATFASTESYGITLTTSAESNVGASTINPNNDDQIIAQSYAYIDPQASSASFYTGQNRHSNPVVILYHWLKDRMAFAESDINISNFQTIAALYPVATFNAFSLPEILGDEPSTNGDVIGKILSSAGLRLFLNNDGKFTLSKIDAFSTAELTLDDTDLVLPKYRITYRDLGRAKIMQTPIEISLSYTKAGGIIPPEGEPARYLFNTYEYNAFKYLHQTAGNEDFGFDREVAGIYGALADVNFGQLVGERRMILSCFLKTKGHALDIGSFVTVTREMQPGFDYVEGTSQSRNFVVVEIEKRLDGVLLVLDDQKAIEDNSGDW